mgnify:CR=1 FL=1
MSNWLRTPDAAKELGVSADFLKRNRDSHDGFLEEGKHYVLGSALNASIRWEVEACRDRIHKHGRLVREAHLQLKKLQEGALGQPTSLTPVAVEHSSSFHVASRLLKGVES